MKESSNSLYWRISATLLLLLVILGIGYISISGYIAQQYYQESVQRLHGSLAETVTKEVKPFKEGVLQKPALVKFSQQHLIWKMEN